MVLVLFFKGRYPSFKHKISLFIFHVQIKPITGVHSSQPWLRRIFWLQFSMFTEVISCKISNPILKEIKDFQYMNVKKSVHCICELCHWHIHWHIWSPKYNESEIPLFLLEYDLNFFSLFLPVLSICFCFYIVFLITVSTCFIWRIQFCRLIDFAGIIHIVTGYIEE